MSRPRVLLLFLGLLCLAVILTVRIDTPARATDMSEWIIVQLFPPPGQVIGYTRTLTEPDSVAYIKQLCPSADCTDSTTVAAAALYLQRQEVSWGRMKWEFYCENNPRCKDLQGDE